MYVKVKRLELKEAKRKAGRALLVQAMLSNPASLYGSERTSANSPFIPKTQLRNLGCDDKRQAKTLKYWVRNLGRPKAKRPKANRKKKYIYNNF